MSKMNWDKISQRSQMDRVRREGDCYNPFKDLPQIEMRKEAAKRIISCSKRKPKPTLSANDDNIKAMKLASQLYKRMQDEPDFADIPKKELWDMAVKQAKQYIKGRQK